MKFTWKRWVAIVAALAALAFLASGCVVNGAWAQVEVSDPASPQTAIVWLSKVSCPTSSFCAAVGTSQSGPVWATWTGDRWGVTPFGARDDELSDVSCISSKKSTSAVARGPIAL